MADEAIDYYFHILGLPSTASLDDVIKAHKFFVQVLHPDIVAQKPDLKEWANKRMTECNTARDKIKDWFEAGCPRGSKPSGQKTASSPDRSTAPDWTVWEDTQRQDWQESVKDWEEAERQRQIYVQLEREKNHRSQIVNLLRGTLQTFVVLMWAGVACGGLTSGFFSDPSKPVEHNPHEHDSLLILFTAGVGWFLLSGKSREAQHRWIETGNLDKEVAIVKAATLKAAKIAAEKATELKAAAEKIAAEKAAELKATMEKAAAEKASTTTHKPEQPKPKPEEPKKPDPKPQSPENVEVEIRSSSDPTPPTKNDVEIEIEIVPSSSTSEKTEPSDKDIANLYKRLKEKEQAKTKPPEKKNDG